MQDRTKSSPEAPGGGFAGVVRLAYEYAAFALAYVIFGTGGILFSLLSMILLLLLPRESGERFGRRAIHVLFRFFVGYLRMSGLVKADLKGLDALKDRSGIVVAPNHPSLLDVVFVISRLPRAVCIMKADLWGNAFLGWGARLAGYIRNDSPTGLVRAGAAELARGGNLLVFPEGTRTISDPVNRFKGGFALIARISEAPVQTILVETDSAFMGKGWPRFKKPAFPLHYRFKPGREFLIDNDEPVRDQVERLRLYYEKELSSVEDS